jgi:PAS domain S-box-containing protein
MSSPAARPASDASPALWQALAEHSAHGLAFVDDAGQLLACNPAFSLLWPQATEQLAHALAELEHTPAIDIEHPGPPPRHLRLHGRPVAGGLVLTLTDISPEHAAEQERRRLAGLLEMAQEFGRLGVWERDARTQQARWDPHIYRFWGLPPDQPPLGLDEALAYIHPEDRTGEVLRASMQQAGTYAHRYRVLRRDGTARLLHSQWRVENGADGRPERVIGIMMDDTEVFELARAATDAHKQLNMAVDLARLASWRHDLQSNRMVYNERAWEVLALPPRAEGMHIDEVRALIHPDDLPGILASAERALQTDRPTDMQARYRRADGSWRHVLTRRVVQRDVNGQPMAFLGVALDITEQVEESRRAAELAKRLEASARAAHVGLWSIEVESGVLHWNPTMLALFGLAPEAQPRTFREWLQQCVHPEDAPGLLATSRDWLRKNGGTTLEMQYRALLPDGSVRWLVNRSDMQLGPDGGTVSGITLDVTEQRAALRALRDANERSALAARGVGMGTWELDLQQGLLFWDEQMFLLRGVAPRPVPLQAGERLSLVHPDDREMVQRLYEQGLAGGEPVEFEFRVHLPDGSWRWLGSRSTTVFDEQGLPLRRIGVNWDITDRKNAEAARQEKAMALRESEAKSQFMARMSHELRTPLNAVLGFAQLLLAEDKPLDPAALKQRLGHIRSAGQHLLSLINDVLELSSLDTGELRLQRQPVALQALADETLPLVEGLAAEHQVALHIGPLEGVALADPTRLRQVLLNLLSNAIKYNRAGGSVTLRSHWDAGAQAQVVLEVADTGRGIDAALLPLVFEPFNRLGLEREGIEGTGIGLAIVKALSERMGGSVQVDSRPGVGSVFRVRLPAAAPQMREVAAASRAAATPSATPAPPGPLSAQPQGRPGRVLYVEDNPVNVLLVRELLALRPALTLEVAVDGESGVAMAKALLPDLVLVDMQLPDFDGHEVLRRLRADPATAALPCVALSANAMPDDIERALKAGFVDYWTKPLDLRAFVAALDERFGPLSS